MKFILLSSGVPSLGVLNVNLDARDEADAKQQAGKVAKRLHVAGWYSHTLFAVKEDSVEEFVIQFRTETADPEIVLGT